MSGNFDFQLLGKWQMDKFAKFFAVLKMYVRLLDADMLQTPYAHIAR